MKAIKILLFIFIPFLASSCGSKEERLKKEYIEACANGDFEKARAAATKLEAEDFGEGWDAIRYINDKEIYTLLAKPSRDNDSRILYLYNSFESDELPDMEDVVAVAISMGNDNLPEKLIKAGVFPTNISMIKAAVDADNKELVELIIKKYPESILDNEVFEYVQNELGISSLSEIVINQLIPTLIVLKKAVPVFHSEGLVGYFNGSDYAEQKMPQENEDITDYNKKVMNIYAGALKINRKDIALEALNSLKPTIEAYGGRSDGEMIKGYKVDGNHYLIYHNYDEINKLKKELGR